MKEYIVNRSRGGTTKIIMFDSIQERNHYINNTQNKVDKKATIYQYENTEGKINFCLDIPVFSKKKK